MCTSHGGRQLQTLLRFQHIKSVLPEKSREIQLLPPSSATDRCNRSIERHLATCNWIRSAKTLLSSRAGTAKNTKICETTAALWQWKVGRVAAQPPGIWVSEHGWAWVGCIDVQSGRVLKLGV